MAKKSMVDKTEKESKNSQQENIAVAESAENSIGTEDTYSTDYVAVI